MTSEKTTITPIPYLATIFGAAGAAKLIGAKPVTTSFRRWGYGSWTRRGVGVIEVGIATAAVKGLEDATLRRAAGAGALLTMAGALRTHRRAHDGALSYLPPVAVAVLGLATYLDTTLVLEP